MSDQDLKDNYLLYKDIAEKLWQLLDDIDTASDMFKPEQTQFYKHIMLKAEKRHKLLKSDGQELTVA